MRTEHRRVYTLAEREKQRAVRASLDAANQREADANFQGIANALNTAHRRPAPAGRPEIAGAAHRESMSTELADLVAWAKTTTTFGPDDFRKLKSLANGVTTAAAPASDGTPLIDEVAELLAKTHGTPWDFVPGGAGDNDPYYRDAHAVVSIIDRERNIEYATAMTEAAGLVNDMTDSLGNTYGADLRATLAHQAELALEDNGAQDEALAAGLPTRP